MNGSFSCNSFAETEWYVYQEGLRQAIKQEIHDQSKDYLLGVEETEYKSYLANKFTFEPLEILEQTERIEPRVEQRPFRNHFGRTGYRDVYVFEIAYNFRGFAELFKLTPNTRAMISHEIHVSTSTQIVSFEVESSTKNPEEFRRAKTEAFRESFANVPNINEDVNAWNAGLPKWINDIVDARKKHFTAENDFFTAINVSPNPTTQEIFSVPALKRRAIPRPEVSPKKQFTRQPTMSDEMYEDVVKVLYQAGRGMERKPSLYRGKSEEDLRDQFLLFLETRYVATTGTGETFNKAGKTDILLKYQDGTNLFVAECKWWAGETQFHASTNQLFDRYLTWRDSKAALLLFVNNKGFSAVVEKVRTEAMKHPYFIRECNDREETSLAFDYHLPNDEQRLVRFAILLFAFP